MILDRSPLFRILMCCNSNNRASAVRVLSTALVVLSTALVIAMLSVGSARAQVSCTVATDWGGDAICNDCVGGLCEGTTSVCRPSSGDLCDDPDEVCPGVVGGECPADSGPVICDDPSCEVCDAGQCVPREPLPGKCEDIHYTCYEVEDVGCGCEGGLNKLELVYTGNVGGLYTKVAK